MGREEKGFVPACIENLEEGGREVELLRGLLK